MRLVICLNQSHRQLCMVSVVVSMDAKLDELSTDDVSRCEDTIVSQWREFSAADKVQVCNRVDEILREFGMHTKLLVMERHNSIALYFICTTLSAVASLRDQLHSGQLKYTVQILFTFLSGATQPVLVQSLSWLHSLHFLSLLPG